MKLRHPYTVTTPCPCGLPSRLWLTLGAAAAPLEHDPGYGGWRGQLENGTACSLRCDSPPGRARWWLAIGEHGSIPSTAECDPTYLLVPVPGLRQKAVITE
jgi:hypothetical protein